METLYLDNLGGSAQADLHKGVGSKVVFVGPRPVKQFVKKGLKKVGQVTSALSPEAH